MLSKTLVTACYNLSKNWNPDPESWCILVHTINQYAEGITGIDESSFVYLQDDDSGYPYAAAAYKAAKDFGIKNKNTKGRRTPYGDIGHCTETRKAVQIKDLNSIYVGMLGGLS